MYGCVVHYAPNRVLVRRTLGKCDVIIVALTVYDVQCTSYIVFLTYAIVHEVIYKTHKEL